MCNEPRKLDKKLSGFYYEEKTHDRGTDTSRQDVPKRAQCRSCFQGVRHQGPLCQGMGGAIPDVRHGGAGETAVTRAGI